jgi:hypothetical protein
MATETSNAITLKGSVDIVTEFLGDLHDHCMQPIHAKYLSPVVNTTTRVCRLQYQQHTFPGAFV